MTEVRFHPRLQIFARAEVYHMCNFDIVELLRHLRHSALEDDRLSDRVAQYHAVAILNE